MSGMKRVVYIFLIIVTVLHSSLFAQEPINQSAHHQDEFMESFDAEYNEANDVFDPLSGYNSAMTTFNDSFYMNFVKPVSTVYADYVHENIRTGVDNVFNNLLFPVRFINNILQFKLVNASEELARFGINSTFGLLGIMDVAKDINLKPHKEDFGQTLGFYGVGSGFHVVLPFIGPSNMRDIVGLSIDNLANPLSSNMGYEPYQIPNHSSEQAAIIGLRMINHTSLHLNEYEKLKEYAVDLYPFLRDVYEQRRKNEIEQ